MTLGETILIHRRRAKLTLAELALRMGSDVVGISRIERGERQPGLEWLYRCATALQIPPSVLDPRLTDTIEPLVIPTIVLQKPSNLDDSLDSTDPVDLPDPS